MEIAVETLGWARPSTGDHELRNVLMRRFLSPWFRLTCWKFPTDASNHGRLRLLLTRANRSPPARGAARTFDPVVPELYPVLNVYVICRFAGTSRVLMSTCAPLKSPGWSGLNVFDVVIVCSRYDAKRSSGTMRFSGSGLGMRAPLSEAVVYRSPSPRTATYFPS